MQKESRQEESNVGAGVSAGRLLKNPRTTGNLDLADVSGERLLWLDPNCPKGNTPMTGS